MRNDGDFEGEVFHDDSHSITAQSALSSKNEEQDITQVYFSDVDENLLSPDRRLFGEPEFAKEEFTFGKENSSDAQGEGEISEASMLNDPIAPEDENNNLKMSPAKEHLCSNLRKYKDAGLPRCLKWLRWKIKTSSTEKAMIGAMRLAGEPESLYQMRKELARSGLRILQVDCCMKGHIAFTRSYRKLRQCPHRKCEEQRYKGSREQAYERFEYFSLEHFVETWLSSESYWRLMQYRHKETNRMRKINQERDIKSGVIEEHWITDYIFGRMYMKLDHEIKFKEGDICFQLSFDGYQLFKSSSYDAWPFILLNLNLPPSERFKIDNIIPFGVTSGPSSPTSVESFLEPLISCFERFSSPKRLKLWNGQAVDVRLFLIFVTADTPALNKILHARGHNAISPCRFCSISGVRSDKSHYYYPSSLFNIDNFARKTVFWRAEKVQEKQRNIKDLFLTLKRMEQSDSKFEQEKISKETGFHRRPPIILRLKSLRAFQSFPIDTMHLLFINIPRYMWKLWNGTLEDTYAKDDFVLSVPHLVGRDMKACGKMIPAFFGRKPRNIYEAGGSFKAAEWKAFILYFSIPLLDERMPEKYLRGWKTYVEVCSIVSRAILSANQVENLRRLTIRFYRHFEKDYFRFQRDRLSLMKYSFHLLLHLPECVRDCGPLCNVDQFKMERYVGYLRTLLKSKFRPVRNLTRNLLTLESLKIIERVSIENDEETDTLRSRRGLRLDPKFYPRYECYSFHSPGGRRALTQTERQLVRNFLRKEGCEEEILHVVDVGYTCQVYGRLLIEENDITVMIGARNFLKISGENSRWNCFIKAYFEDDENVRSWYGVVEKFLHVDLSGTRSYLVACIRWAERVFESPYGVTYAKSSDLFGRLSVESIECLRVTSLIGLVNREDLKRTYFISQD